MAENGTAVPVMQQREQQQFKCTGNCLNCPTAQRIYCASQHAYSNMRVLDRMMEEVVTMKENVMALAEKVEAIQNNDACVFDPHLQAVEPVAKQSAEK